MFCFLKAITHLEGRVLLITWFVNLGHKGQKASQRNKIYISPKFWVQKNNRECRRGEYDATFTKFLTFDNHPLRHDSRSSFLKKISMTAMPLRFTQKGLNNLLHRQKNTCNSRIPSIYLTTLITFLLILRRIAPWSNSASPKSTSQTVCYQGSLRSNDWFVTLHYL